MIKFMISFIFIYELLMILDILKYKGVLVDV